MRKENGLEHNLLQIFFCVTTVQIEPMPPRFRDFIISPFAEALSTQQTQETKVPARGGFRIRGCNNEASVDLRVILYGHRDRLGFLLVMVNRRCWIIYFLFGGN